MKHVDTKIEEDLVMFEKYSLTPNELFFLKLLLLAKEDDDLGPLSRYWELAKNNGESPLDWLRNLQNKGIILQSFVIPKPGEKFNPLDVPLSKNFQKHFFKASYDLGKDLFEAYPVSTVVNGVEYKLRRISKKFNSLEDAFRTYGKYIGWSYEHHQHVIELVEWGKANNYQFTTLDDFIVDNDWLNIEELAADSILSHTGLKLL